MGAIDTFQRKGSAHTDIQHFKLNFMAFTV